MKKLFLLLPAFLLCGCVNAKSVSFKSLRFDNPLAGDQIDEFMKGFEEKAKSANEMTMERIAYSKTDENESKVTDKAKYQIFSNGMKGEVSSEIKDSTESVKYTSSEKTTYNTWVVTKDGVSKQVSINKSSLSKDPTIDVDSFDDEESPVSLTMLVAALSNGEVDPVDVDFYAKGKGYAAVYSNHEKLVDYVTGVAGSRERIRTFDKQLVIQFNKDFEVTSGSYFYEVQTNFDVDSKTFYANLKTCDKIQVALKLGYGKIEARSEAEMFTALGDTKDEYFISAKPIIKGGYWSGAGDEPSKSTFAPVAFTEYEAEENGNGRILFEAKFKFSSTLDALLRSLKAEITYLTKDGFKVEEVNGPYFTNAAAFYGSTTTDTEPEPFYYTTDAEGEEFLFAGQLSSEGFIGSPTVAYAN